MTLCDKLLHESIHYLNLVMIKLFAYVKTKPQISCAVTAQLISAFDFATHIVQSLFFLNPKFQASSHLLWLHSLVCVRPGRKPRRPVFSQRGSIFVINGHYRTEFVVCALPRLVADSALQIIKALSDEMFET